jgi:CBS domain containing-hemolysin-like protein
LQESSRFCLRPPYSADRRFLSTVQIGITLVGILSGALSGATLGLRLAEWTLEAPADALGFLFAITDKS